MTFITVVVSGENVKDSCSNPAGMHAVISIEGGEKDCALVL